MRPSINLRYKSLLLTCLLILAAGAVAPAWGSYTIKYKNGAPQTGITERVDTVYVADGVARELFVPEMRYNTDERYFWYIRWYMVNAEGDTLVFNDNTLKNINVKYDTNNPPQQGGDVKEGTFYAWLKKTKDNKSLFAYRNLYKQGTNKADRSITGASTVEYKASSVIPGITVYCDVSMNIDYGDIDTSTKDTIVTEPSLSVRYKFVIEPATKIADRIAKSGNEPFIQQNITTSGGNKNVNIQIGATANNYAWYDNGSIVVGKIFRYKVNDQDYQIEGRIKNSLYPFVQLIDSLTITDTTTVDVWAVNGTSKSPILARYIITPETDSGFMLEDENMLKAREDGTLDPRRNPDAYPELYKRIGYINFDRNDTILISQLTPMNNMAAIHFPDKGGKWLEPDVTGYAPFDYEHIINKDVLLPWGPQVYRLQTLQNQYGLFRTAELPDVSTIAEAVNGMCYYWYTKLHIKTTPPIYDRTYYNTNKDSLGYFFYVDAANLPGRLVKIKLDGEVCRNTGLLVNFWVNDMTTMPKGANGPLPPNINMLFIGKDADGKETVLHRFTSGDALTDYTAKYNGNPANKNIGKWQQLMYTFTLPQSLDNYDEYYLEVQNNTAHAYGADYAIDGLRIYRTIPKIDVTRVDACSSANLTVSTDYDLLLKNMGWNINPNVLSDLNLGGSITEGSKHIWKYRYGLMGSDPRERNSNLNPTIGNVYFGATDKRETGDIGEPNDWITLNTDLKNYSNPNYNNRSKVYRIIVPTENGLAHEGFQDLTDYETAMRRQIVVNLRMVNDFLYDTETNYIWNDDIRTYAVNDGRFNEEDEYVESVKERLEKLCGKAKWDYIVPEPESIAIDKIRNGQDGYDEIYELLIRDVCSVLDISRARVPWWESTRSNVIHLSAINVSKTELKYKGERIFANDAATGEYDVIIFSASATTGTDEVVDFPNEFAGSSFQDPCLLTTPFTVLPSFTVVAKTETSLPSGNIACVGRISAVDEATVWVRQMDEANNLLDDQDEFTDKFNEETYTFDWFLGTMEEYEQFNASCGTDFDLAVLLKEFRTTLGAGRYKHFEESKLIAYCKSHGEYNKNDIINGLSRLLGLDNVNTEPKLIIGDVKGKAEFRWTEWVVMLPVLPDVVLEGDESNMREYLFCEKPQERRLDTAPGPTLLAGFPDVAYPQEMEYYPNVPLRIGLPNIMERTITNVPVQNIGLSMGMETSNRLGMLASEGDEANSIYLRQGSTYTAVGKLTSLSAKKKVASNEADYGGGLFSMTFDEKAYQQFNEGQIYALYIPFGEYNDDGFVDGSCEGYATLLIKIVPEYLTWQGTHTSENAEAWYNDKNWKQSTKGELYIDPDGTNNTDANGNDDVTAAFAPLHFTRITIPGGRTLELEDLKTKDHLLQIPEANSSKATEYIQYDMAVDKDGNNTIVTPYYINKVKAIYFKPEAQLRRQQFLTYDTARVEFEMTPNAKYWMASPLQSVFAGDMYTVKNTGRQNTYAFADITYSTANNNRQAPAFYQKAWDKAITMYVPKSEVDPVDPNPSTVPSPIYPEDDLNSKDYKVVQSNWSCEYNDVNVPYALGKGFYASVEAKNAQGLNGNVLVRLPKADKSYSYEPLTKTAPTLANRTNSGKLADKERIEVVLADSDEKDSWWNGETVIADGDGTHFLLGNPYMYPLDIAKFLKANNSVLAEKYWTLDTNGEGLVVGTPDVAWKNGDITDATSEAVIAPMQAFFVELKGTEDATQTKAEGTTTGADLKVVRFDPSMMQGEPDKASSSLRTATAKNPVLRLTAERDAYRSTALLTRQDDAANSYEADKDAVILLDTELKEIPQVYTIAGTRAVGVNVVQRIDQIPLGVYAGEGKGEVTLTIEGIGDWAETLYLYDADTRKSVELTGDSYTLRLDGSSHGRYFLNAGSPTGNERIDDAESISIYSAVSGRVVASAGEALKRIQVFTPMGRLVRTLYPARPTYTFALPAGIYIIRAEIAHDQKTVKLRVL